ncbi:CoA transferase [Mycolicibacterium sp. CH28]|uniref:CaiB/BaiF CoA-transferase family protein n=1 Tax=Mycolicibacterium sp. CH28 TaxID=2512237 RepID=UPI001081F232|nr:CoA transferase [Mycolicibacterium sp. CH28]TGD85907.1 CoA transferase [Mycolicibacterium sp. CH28]
MIADDAPLLDDVTVGEVGRSEALAWSGRVLSDLGAKVVRWNPVDETGAYSAFLHRGKGQIGASTKLDVLIYDDDEGRRLADEFRRDNPRLVVVSVSDYGTTGPMAGTPASELTLQAEAGIVAVHPTHGGPPVSMGVNLAEQLAGRWAVIGALAGLLAVERGAPGTEVDVSRFESVVSVLQYPWLMAQFPDSYAYPVPQMAVPGIEPAKDGWVCVVAVSPQQWSAFKQLASDSRLDNPRFDLLVERIRLAEEVRPILHEFTRRHTVAELVAMGTANRLPITPVTEPATAGDFGPYAERNRLITNEDGSYAGPRSPIRADIGSSAPGAGALTTAAGTPQRPLRGVRVAEIASFQAGPLVGSYLAALGADVIRVESTARPDVMRLSGTPSTVDRFWERSAPFAGVNVDKRSIAAELTDPRGRAIIDRLISSSHVLVENYVPRVLDDRGLDYAGVKALQPTIVMTRMPAWGSTGPWRDQPGFTFTANAASGISWMTGYPEGEPLLSGTVFDPIAAITATAATLAAILRQLRSGLGAQLEIALCDVALEVSAPHITAASEGRQPVRSGNRREGIAPQGIYRTSDARWVAISVTTDEQWSALTGISGVPAWAAEASLNTHAERMLRHGDLDEMLSDLCAEHGAEHLVSTLRALGIPAAEMKVGTDLTEHPQLLARQRVYALEHPIVGPARYIGLPARFSHAPTASSDRPTPLFGEHSREVLGELGFSSDEIDTLDAAGALGQSPFGLPFAQRQHQPQQ